MATTKIPATQRKKFEEMILRRAEDARAALRIFNTTDINKHLKSCKMSKAFHELENLEKSDCELRRKIRDIEVKLRENDKIESALSREILSHLCASHWTTTNSEGVKHVVHKTLNGPKQKAISKLAIEATEEIWLIDAGEDMKGILEKFQQALAKI